MSFLRWQDFVVIAISVVVVLAIGAVSARRSKSAEGYFLAGRSMPGWVLGFSMMATLVSAMTFLALPAMTYEFNWWHFPGQLTFLVAIVVAVVLFVPLYRGANISSAYEYLERRFGTWARLYGAACFLLFHVFRMGIVLYITSLAVQAAVGGDLIIIMLVLGVLVAAYTIVGGLQAVIWTDFFQGIALIGGGLLILPLIAAQLPEGFGQIIDVGRADQKFSWSNMQVVQQTTWAVLCSKLFMYLMMLGTDQTSVQRYLAARSDRDARNAVLLGGILGLPLWTYFFFIGTALYVFYKVVPDPAMADLKTDQIFSYFILTQLPGGLAGFVIVGLLAAALSTLDSSINACAATVTNDFYRRLWSGGRSSEHYANAGKILSLAFSVLMIGTATAIHLNRSQSAVEHIQTIVLSVFGGGLLSLFLLGFLTRRVHGRSACVATGVTVLTVAIWLLLDSKFAEGLVPSVSQRLPDRIWIGVWSNVILFSVGYGLSWLLKSDKENDLSGLTIWTASGRGTGK